MMRANRLFFYGLTLLFVLLIVGCSRGTDDPLPTAIPTAIPLIGPPGTNAIDAPWEQVDDATAGLSIQHPQDWNSSLIETGGIRLTPILTDEYANNEFTLVASIVNFAAEQYPTVTDANDVTAVLNAILANPALGPADNIAQRQPVTPLSMNGFTGVAATVQIDAPELDLPEEEINSETTEDVGARNAVFMYVAVINQGGRTAVFTATTSVDTAERYQPIFDAIIKTTTFSAPSDG